MRVNSDKTMMLCISDSRTYTASAYIESSDGEVVSSSPELKNLGMHFSSKPDMAIQVDSICRKFRARIWTLRHLYQRGFSQQELVKVYKSTILPSHDYCSTVYHSSLTLSQTIVLERLQAKALKTIFGFEQSYRELVERAGLTTLRARREARELAFARKCAGSVRFGHWFPARNQVRDTRDGLTFEERFARTLRCYNSPIYSMRRRLNRDRAELGAREGRADEDLRTARA